jgi:hypothetical protein
MENVEREERGRREAEMKRRREREQRERERKCEKLKSTYVRMERTPHTRKFQRKREETEKKRHGQQTVLTCKFFRRRRSSVFSSSARTHTGEFFEGSIGGRRTEFWAACSEALVEFE